MILESFTHESRFIHVFRVVRKMRASLGDIRRFQDADYRVLVQDSLEVMCDVRNYADSFDWIFGSNARIKPGYFRRSAEAFVRNGKLIGCEPLTELERRIHRPDLPLRAFRSKAFAWGREAWASLDEVHRAVARTTESNVGESVIPCDRIIVVPMKPRETHAKEMKLEADTAAGISMAKFLWEVHRVQLEYWKKPSAGVGLFRLGHCRGVPSYYAGEYYDAAGILPRE